MAGITSGFGELLRSGNYSDFRITCKGAEFNVHRAIVCSASDFFKALCDSGFKEQSAGSVDLPDDDPETVKRMIDFLYTGRYDALDSNESSISSGGVARASSTSSEHASMTAEEEETNGHQIDSEESDSDVVSPDYENIMKTLGLADLARLKIHVMVYLVADKFDMKQLKTLPLLHSRKASTASSKRHEKTAVLPTSSRLHTSRRVATITDYELRSPEIAYGRGRETPKLSARL